MTCSWVIGELLGRGSGGDYVHYKKDTAMVTIIIPVYNRQRFIAEAIESILHQPFQDFEIIIVDDGSTDGTKRVIEKYLHDERISYYQQEHSGKPSVAR